MTTCQVSWFPDYGNRSSLTMALSKTWLNLNELSRTFGISSGLCKRALQEQGWRDKCGYPTQAAIQAGAASSNSHEEDKPTSTNTLWNIEMCKTFLKLESHEQLLRTAQVNQWATLFEALEEGSPSINTTPDEMAEDLPCELVGDVNAQLALRGCQFRVSN